MSLWTPSVHLLIFLLLHVYTHNAHSLYFYVFLVFGFSSLHLLYLSLNFPLWSPPWQSATPPTPDHIHMLIIKSPTAPPHLWGNPLAGHPCLSDKEQHRCFILTSLLIRLFLSVSLIPEHMMGSSMWLDPGGNRYGLKMIPPATAAVFNNPKPD